MNLPSLVLPLLKCLYGWLSLLPWDIECVCWLLFVVPDPPVTPENEFAANEFANVLCNANSVSDWKWNKQKKNYSGSHESINW